jgi:hypothetical protein
MGEIGLSGTPVAERVFHTEREHLARVIRNWMFSRSLSLQIFGLSGTEFGLSGTNFRVIGNKTSGFQELERRVFRNSANGLLGTEPHPKPPESLQNLGNAEQLTRARDLNPEITLVTPPKTRRLNRGLRPLGASNPTHPPYPHKDRPPGEPKNSRHHRAAALRTAGK